MRRPDEGGIGGCGGSSGPLPSRSLEIVTMISSLTVPTHLSETHPLHPLDPLDPLAGRKTIGQRAAFASYSRSVAGSRFRNRYGVQELASGARAGQHRLVDLTFTDLRQLADIAAGLQDVVSHHGLIGLPASS